MLIFSSKGCVCLQIQRSRLTETILSAAEGGSVAVGEGPELFFLFSDLAVVAYFCINVMHLLSMSSEVFMPKQTFAKGLYIASFVNANEPTR